MLLLEEHHRSGTIGVRRFWPAGPAGSCPRSTSCWPAPASSWCSSSATSAAKLRPQVLVGADVLDQLVPHRRRRLVLPAARTSVAAAPPVVARRRGAVLPAVAPGPRGAAAPVPGPARSHRTCGGRSDRGVGRVDGRPLPARTGPSRLYYGTDTRISAILMGALLALLLAAVRAGPRRDRRHGPLFDVIGVAALVGSCCSSSTRRRAPPAASTGAASSASPRCVGAGRGRGGPPRGTYWSRKALGAGALAWIGVRSYALYLWHWPIFVLTRPDLDVPLSGWPLLVLRLGLTVVLADLSYRLVERPIRRIGLRSWVRRTVSIGPPGRRRPVAAAVVLGAVVAAGGVAVVMRAGKPPVSDIEQSLRAGQEAIASRTDRDRARVDGRRHAPRVEDGDGGRRHGGAVHDGGPRHHPADRAHHAATDDGRSGPDGCPTTGGAGRRSDRRPRGLGDARRCARSCCRPSVPGPWSTLRWAARSGRSSASSRR